MGDQAMRLDTSLLDGIHATNTAAKSSSTASHKSSGTTSFTSALKAASSTTSPDTTKPATDVAETTQAVTGHPYAEILTGPRAGMYLNTSHNKRAGDAFVMVHRNGVELHVYGTGKNRHVVEMKRHTPLTTPTPTATTGTSAPSTATPATATTPTATTTTGTTSSGTVTSGKITTDTSTL